MTEVSDIRVDEMMEVLGGSTMAYAENVLSELEHRGYAVRRQTSTLPQMMRTAALVLEEARAYFHNLPENENSGWIARNWTAEDLLKYAHVWEIREGVRKQRERDHEQLRATLSDGMREYGMSAGAIASELIEQGWTRVDKDGQE